MSSEHALYGACSEDILVQMTLWYQSESEYHRIRVDGEIFVSGKKKLRIQKYPDSCGRSLRKPRRQRQRERRQTKGLMSRTMAVYVSYNSWYISLLSSAKRQRQVIKFCVL